MPAMVGWGGGGGGWGGQLLIMRSYLNILKSMEACYKAIQLWKCMFIVFHIYF